MASKVAQTGTSVTVAKGSSADKEYLSEDKHYCSPNANLVLISKEKVAFRTDAWHMSRQSDFIGNLLDVPSEQNIEMAPIHVDFTHDVVRYFLDLLTPSPSAKILVEIGLCTKLLQLSDMFGTPRVERYILDSMRAAMSVEKGKKPPINAWAVFKVAASRDDVALAQAAIACFEISGYSLQSLIQDASPSSLDGVPAVYYRALVRCLLEFKRAPYTSEELPHKRSPEVAAHYFHLA